MEVGLWVSSLLCNVPNGGFNDLGSTLGLGLNRAMMRYPVLRILGFQGLASGYGLGLHPAAKRATSITLGL